MGDISERWALDGSRVRVKFVTPDSDAFSASMNADVDNYLSQHLPTRALSIVQSSQTVDRKLKEWSLYRAVDIQKDILQDHRVRLPYKSAWMGKEIAQAAIHGKEVGSYDLLLWYAEEVAEMNPCSFLGCRPLLFVDGTRLLGKYGGILLGATIKDGNEGIFHVAFAIVDNKTDDNWTWFLATLGEALYIEDDYEKVITFISDRSKGLVNVVSHVFPLSPHGYCLRYLEANFMKANGSLGKSLEEQCWVVIVKIAYAYTSKEFNDAWCEMYYNVAESFNAWIKEARHLPVTSMVDTIRFKLINMLTKRREVSTMWDTYLCPEICQKVEQIVESSRFSRVGGSSDDTYKVIDDHNSGVNLRVRKCSCRRWEVHGLLCKDAAAAIMQTDTNVNCYIDKYFTVESYHRAYAELIYSIPDSDKPSDGSR
ncbi:uncharacterized protein LOC120284095 [Dioscorea cayenensis subsp. rotundata]|uniref:Uncharacterized protein LOC120284095 n=1 Tax=Dioscorea cayennensis subsp. rotundata TaxID=55577 RepID=A0AB40D6N5_DIOCR|nr:uncharacterized protein LOC120284095 [Dioscorea cayenensis subsp. rotundata]